MEGEGVVGGWWFRMVKKWGWEGLYIREFL
jgi:hypothetical protein